MPLPQEIAERVRRFVDQSAFARAGAVVTDLDGTAVHELAGRVAIPPAVELGLKAVYDVGRPVIINSLRFPLSVMRTFGREWMAIAGGPIPTVSLNGSQIGTVLRGTDGGLVFEEIAAFPLAADDIDEMLAGVQGLLDGGVQELALFHYPRDWRQGELIWTPSDARVEPLRSRYTSASAVWTSPIGALRERLHADEQCMVFLLVDAPEDRLMAYQHTRRTSFFTRAGVDKLHGARAIAAHLDVDLGESVGAGDAELDRFLAAVGLAVHVGNMDLEFHGRRDTIRLRSAPELGDLLFELAGAARGNDALRGSAALPT